MTTDIPTNPVTSSNVAAVGYDAPTSTLAVEFKHGGTYYYAGVPAEVHAAMMTAESVGTFLATEIKGKYDYTKVA